MKPLIVLFSLVAGSVMAQNTPQPSVNVVGKGVISVVPDRVQISVEVNSEGKDVKSVKTENDRLVNKVFRFLQSSHIDKKNYQTQYVNLSKQYDYNTKEYKYAASQSISILLTDLDKYDTLMQGLLDSGINQINDVSFDVSNRAKYEKEARKKAVINAKEKAEEYASALGQQIGKAFQITGSITPVMYPKGNHMMLYAEKSQAAEPTLMQGSMQIEAEVNVSFELK